MRAHLTYRGQLAVMAAIHRERAEGVKPCAMTFWRRRSPPAAEHGRGTP